MLKDPDYIESETTVSIELKKQYAVSMYVENHIDEPIDSEIHFTVND